MTREILEGLGYRVLEVADGEDALVVAQASRERIDLLLTDVVMPRLSGGELARRLCAERPSLKVLLVSGYTDESVRHHLVAEDAPPILEKPFDRERLGRAVREALDRPAPAEGRAES
ncbi:MAG: response regulator [Vicinamibacteria bacterium]